MENYAWIENGVVTNVIVWDGNTDPSTGGFAAPDGVTLVKLEPDNPAWIGWGWNGSNFIAPEVEPEQPS